MTTQMKNLSVRNSLFKEISDDTSASVTGGAVRDFDGVVPSLGYKTFPTVYTTTSQFNDISIRMFNNPYELSVKAVRADGTGNVSTRPRTIPANFRGVITVAKNVLDGTRFKLSFGALKTKAIFYIKGRMTY